ncbi:hypothetical protein QJS10_CPA09g00260 [Acorus calamus]|uniref:Uncharacterized protein n=1 Tax=Acorus calamus TaxID=4465 RepID=A0AAV9E7L7_ACOCL|nr:hypothetical protein QJS10_CPA09g00260 [Acorus calamus]
MLYLSKETCYPRFPCVLGVAEKRRGRRGPGQCCWLCLCFPFNIWSGGRSGCTTLAACLCCQFLY